MIVVSNTTPLHYLVLIDAVDLLPVLFGEVWTPPAVISELNDPSTPKKVRDWFDSRPNWLHVMAPSIELDLDLGAGELQAIALADQLKPDFLLIDDRKARQVAEDRGLVVTGTLGVLVKAASRQLIDLPNAFDKLRQTSFHVSATLINNILNAQI